MKEKEFVILLSVILLLAFLLSSIDTSPTGMVVGESDDYENGCELNDEDWSSPRVNIPYFCPYTRGDAQLTCKWYSNGKTGAKKHVKEMCDKELTTFCTEKKKYCYGTSSERGFCNAPTLYDLCTLETFACKPQQCSEPTCTDNRVYKKRTWFAPWGYNIYECESHANPIRYECSCIAKEEESLFG